ncbi:wax ester/triacylglycerol synthase family O-acyltransferase [Massilia sp. TS11]|uniref:WS/DGAT/MGAT family O-acyltransferase n=1 Tax=Massilia sp. TS11 TaxID=2908003 RepID=UPI001ED9E17A|nr:wax ester/triacylglycerol synthase family O-acyltransferase [Massilia sp. TS11]MCG2584738.1 wax ester/triacylglycerol synthase family O-acyltransferase [Massilia sp. TS11]
MKHLSGLDATFLHFETPEMPMHVGGLHLLEPPPELKGDFVDLVRAHVRSRLHLAEVLTKKLALMPLEIANPIWVDEPHVDLDYHIRAVQLPKGATLKQLEAYVARLHSGLLDRSRPLWEFYVFTGLKSGQLAFYGKIHHAALDGQGAVALAQALLDATPLARKVPPAPPRSVHSAAPPAKQMLAAALRDTVKQCVRLVKGVPTGVKVAAGLLLPSRDEDGKRQLGWPKGFTMAPRTHLSGNITSQRVFATASFSQAEMAAIGKAFGGTLNDALLCVVGGALRRYLIEHDACPEKSLVAALPVSLRGEGDADMHNQVSMMLLALASQHEDPAKRMRALVKATQALKETVNDVRAVLPTEFPSLGLPWLMSGLASLYGRSHLAEAMPPVANIVVSNVPGPRTGLYLAGARVTATYPISIITHGLALNVTVQTYNGQLDAGVVACRRAMPDIDRFIVFMHEVFESLQRAAENEAAAERKPRRARKPKAA